MLIFTIDSLVGYESVNTFCEDIILGVYFATGISIFCAFLLYLQQFHSGPKEEAKISNQKPFTDLTDYGFEFNSDNNEYSGEIAGYRVIIKYHAALGNNRPGISAEILFNPKKEDGNFLTRKELRELEKNFKCPHSKQVFLTRSRVLIEYHKKAKNFNLDFLIEDIHHATEKLKEMNLPAVSEEKSEQLHEEFKQWVGKK